MANASGTTWSPGGRTPTQATEGNVSPVVVAIVEVAGANANGTIWVPGSNPGLHIGVIAQPGRAMFPSFLLPQWLS